jgi:hypothetical protein
MIPDTATIPIASAIVIPPDKIRFGWLKLVYHAAALASAAAFSF